MARIAGQKKEYYKRITFRLSEDLRQNIEKYAHENEITINAAVRTILTSFLQNYGKPRNKSSKQ